MIIQTAIKVFKYVEPLWLGTDKKISLRAVAAIALLVDFIRNLSHAVYKWDVGRSLEGLSFVLGIEAGLVVSLLGLTAWTNLSHRRIRRDYEDFGRYDSYTRYNYDNDYDSEKPSDDPDVPKVEVPNP